MRNIIYILHIIIAMFFFASCEDDGAVMLGDNEPCYTILVSAPSVSDTRAYYKEDGENLAVVWEKGDVVIFNDGNQEYTFVFKEMSGNNGVFYHYGAIDNATRWTGTVSFGSTPGTINQTQEKNNVCGEHLVANVTTRINLNNRPTISLLPADNMSLLHIQTKSPGMLLGRSLLKIKGLAQNVVYTDTLGKKSEYVFADQGDLLDIYVVVPAGMNISTGTTLRFYFYSYDEVTGSAETGDEYHYYMKCNEAITTKNNEVVKMSLPNKPTHTAIQLGLSVKWATMNIGATSDQPGEASFGKYLPWGMTEEHFEFAWEDPNLSMLYRKTNGELKAVFGNGFSGSIQGITPREYMGDTYGDPATCLWGDDWVIPTRNQINELMEQMRNTKVQGAKFTNWVEWAKDYVIPHVKTNGCYVYGKDSYSNKKVWFPAAGGVHSEKRGTPESPASNDGCNGVYMTASTASTSPGKQPSCSVFMFNGDKKNGSVGDFSLGCSDRTVYNFDIRIHGCSVRPIRKP
ncbi:MAG: hypothetical protein UH071_11390 [Paludibacteraceae bacterium]|nr:hypothetical protein [Paludibacteraceae bacterium]